MGITVTPQEKIISPGKLLDLMRRSPYVMAELKREEDEREAEALKGRLRCLDELVANGKEIARLQREVEKQKPITDAAHDRYIEQAAKLGELTNRVAHLQSHEGKICGSLGADHGEAKLDDAISKLDGGMRWLVSEIAQMRDRWSSPAGLDPESVAYTHRKEMLAKADRFERYHREYKAAYARALELRMARISPAALADEVDKLLEPLTRHNHE